MVASRSKETVCVRGDREAKQFVPVWRTYSEGNHHNGSYSVGGCFGDEAVNECSGRKGIQNFSMVRAAVGAERYGPVWDGESIFEFGSRFCVAGEETGRECIVGGGESVDGDFPATVSEEGVDAFQQMWVRDGSGDVDGRVSGEVVDALVDED